MDRQYYVVDTNVCVVANFNHENISCIRECVKALIKIKDSGRLVLDANGCILKEYRNNKSDDPQDIGNHFIMWAHDNQYNLDYCERVELSSTDPACNEFFQFPGDPRLKKFDRSDRKFLAVAAASTNNPTIINATDSRSWWKYRHVLSSLGYNVCHLCPHLMSK